MKTLMNAVMLSMTSVTVPCLSKSILHSLAFLCLFILGSGYCNAYDIEVGNIYYNIDLDDMTASVTVGPNGTYYNGDVVIPEVITYNTKTFTVTSIGSSAFKSCYNLTSVKLPSTIERIDDYAFSECTELTSIQLPDGIEKIGAYAFDGCAKLSSINIPTNIKVLDHYAFSSTAIKEVSIPNGLEKISYGAFYSCENLKSVIIANSVVSIGSEAFSRCYRLEFLQLPHSKCLIGGGAFTWTQLGCLFIPDGTIELKDGCFEKGPKAIIIEDGTSDIDAQDPMGCYNDYRHYPDPFDVDCVYFGRKIGETHYSLHGTWCSICVPKVIIFGEFFDTYYYKDMGLVCNEDSLEKVISKSTNPQAIARFDNKTYANVTLYVPIGAKEKYLNTEGWKQFFNIQEIDMSEYTPYNIWAQYQPEYQNMIADKVTIPVLHSNGNNVSKIYNLQGVEQPSLMKGINIVKLSDGSTKKVLVK